MTGDPPRELREIFPRYQWMPSEMTWLKTGEKIFVKMDGTWKLGKSHWTVPFRGWETQPICSKISEPQGLVREPNHKFLSCHHLPEQCRKIPSYPHGITWPYPREGKLGNSSTQRNRWKSWDMLVLMEDFSSVFPPEIFQEIISNTCTYNLKRFGSLSG